jgi:hypothetical protein
MVVRYQIIERRQMRADLAALRHPQSRRASVLRLQSLLFSQFLEQIFISHCHLTEAANTSMESHHFSPCKC